MLLLPVEEVGTSDMATAAAAVAVAAAAGEASASTVMAAPAGRDQEVAELVEMDH